jgi:DNA invertase Pin-like site-specific DNA recombinase
MGKMFFNIFAEFDADLIRMRTREGNAVARAKGKLGLFARTEGDPDETPDGRSSVRDRRSRLR